jgi:hypothetical protein
MLGRRNGAETLFGVQHERAFRNSLGLRTLCMYDTQQRSQPTTASKFRRMLMMDDENRLTAALYECYYSVGFS